MIYVQPVETLREAKPIGEEKHPRPRPVRIWDNVVFNDKCPFSFADKEKAIGRVVGKVRGKEGMYYKILVHDHRFEDDRPYSFMAEWVERTDRMYFYCPTCGRFGEEDLSGGDYDECFTCPKCGKKVDPENDAFGEFPFWQVEKVEGHFRCRECGLIHKTLEGAYECHTGHDPSWWIRDYVKFTGMNI